MELQNLAVVALVATGIAGSAATSRQADGQSFSPSDPSRGLVLRGTVVTMDAEHTVIPDGSVLVRNGRIVAVWQHEHPPAALPIEDVDIVAPGKDALIFPGMINLHNHPTYDMLRLWPAPTSDAQPALGRPLGSEPYANRYQWNGTFAASPEYLRLVETPQLALVTPQGLNLEPEMVKFAKLEALVGGETTTEGGRPDPATDGLLARNVESANFGMQRIGAWVPSIDTLVGGNLAALLAGMQGDQVDAWLFHLAEGVRHEDRRPGDTFSSRGEFDSLKAKGLLTDMTVIIHGTALEAPDFVEMRAAPSIRTDGTGDGLGAKLVWSPLSNLLLYGHTTNVYEALAAGVLVSLGTDWSPSGSRNLLSEVKIADIALRDPTLLGSSRDLVPAFAIDGKTASGAAQVERALDRLLIDMVTRNPAKTVRWQDQVGSIEPGKVADLFVITEPGGAPRAGLPPSPYRSLIDATERDVRLVLVGGAPLVGDLNIMARLKPGDFEAISSDCLCYRKGVVVTKAGLPNGDETLAAIEERLNNGLIALGGDHSPPGGGPADLSNTYSYLKQHFTLPFPMTDAQFMQLVLIPEAGTIAGKLNLERLTLTPLLVDDDEFFFDVLGARFDPATGILVEPTPPFLLYASNPNQDQNSADPFAPTAFEDRWYPLWHPGIPMQGRSGRESRSICVVATRTCARR